MREERHRVEREEVALEEEPQGKVSTSGSGSPMSRFHSRINCPIGEPLHFLEPDHSALTGSLDMCIYNLIEFVCYKQNNLLNHLLIC